MTSEVNNTLSMTTKTTPQGGGREEIMILRSLKTLFANLVERGRSRRIADVGVDEIMKRRREACDRAAACEVQADYIPKPGELKGVEIWEYPDGSREEVFVIRRDEA